MEMINFLTTLTAILTALTLLLKGLTGLFTEIKKFVNVFFGFDDDENDTDTQKG